MYTCFCLCHTCRGICVPKDVDCLGTCHGKAVLDKCGVCNGDNSACSGCKDTTACNFAAKAIVTDNSLCKFPKDKLHDCNGNCIKYDCKGTCGGSAKEDKCGVCGGNDSTCTGCKDQDACFPSTEWVIDSKSKCTYATKGFCDDRCKAGRDCEGKCGGASKADACSVCNGDGATCAGCKDPTACNFDSNWITHDQKKCQTKHSYFDIMTSYNKKMQRGPSNKYNCKGECISSLDCDGVCGGTKVKDVCGVCGGDSSTCTGCMDPKACTFDVAALVHDASDCTYVKDDRHDCNGVCVAGYNCHGECQPYRFDGDCPYRSWQHLWPFTMAEEKKGCNLVPSAPIFYDACGVCDGDNSTCTGCMDPKACNYNALNRVDGGGCTYPPANDWLWTRVGSGRCADANNLKFGYYQYGNIQTVAECKALCERYYLCIGITYGSNSCHVLISKGGFDSAEEPPPQKKFHGELTTTEKEIGILYGQGKRNFQHDGTPMHLRNKTVFIKQESPVAPAAVTDYKGEGRVAQAKPVPGYTCYSLSRGWCL